MRWAILIDFSLTVKAAARMCVQFMKNLTVYTLNSHLLTLKAHNHNMYVFCRPLEYLSTALAKNHAKPAKGDTSHVTKMNIFCFSQLIMS